MSRFVTVLSILLLAACDSSPTLVVADYQPLNPPPLYEDLYALAEACVGGSGDFHSVRWFTAEVIHLPDENGDWLSWGGMYVRPSDIILRSDMVADTFTVIHESKHHVLGRTDHDHSAFDRECM